MSQPAEIPTIEKSIESWLPVIDAELHGVPIPERCMRAALVFVESVVVDVQGDDKDKFWTKPWFRPIYQSIASWYRERYGEAVERAPDHLVGACGFLGAVFELHVPKTLIRLETEGETTWLIFPGGLWEDELASSWIVRPPNLALLEAKDRDALLQDVEKLGRQLRSTFLNLVGGDDDDLTNELMRMVEPHLSTAASHLVRQRDLGLACWEAHQAVEKVLKVLARQHIGNHRASHEVRTLCDDLARSGLPLPNNSLLSTIPGRKQIIALRAGETQIESTQAYDIYRACLEAAAICSAAAKRKYHLNNFRVLLRKPPYI